MIGKKDFTIMLAAACAVLLSTAEVHAYGSFGNDVNGICGATLYDGQDCTFCHAADSKRTSTPAKDAYLAGGAKLTDYFCPTPAPPPPDPNLIDGDKDGYTPAQGDCNDNDPAINPSAAENCTDNIDNDCDNLVDAADSNAVGCPVPCTDSDGDGFAVEGGTCGPVDCDDGDAAINPDANDIPNNNIDENCDGADSVDPTLLDKDGDGYIQAQDCDDTNASINPGAVDIPNNGIDENCDGKDTVDSSIVDNDGDGFTPADGDCDDTDGAINPAAVELCTDGVDNDCNGLVDTQDANAVDCPVIPACTDGDGDTYAVDGNGCGPVDCDDTDASVNPGSQEFCDDNVDNDCDGLVDEGCDAACPDADGDGYLDAVCGGNDCNDDDPSINPAAAEVCGNEVDENCNGASDADCTTCPDGSSLSVRRIEYEGRTLHAMGRGKSGTTLTITNTGTERVLQEGIVVREGKWEVEIKRLRRAPRWISVTSSDGCSVDQRVRREYRQDSEREDDGWSRSSDD